MKYFYLIAGANGSGKTTFAKELLLNLPDFVFLNTDEIALEVGDDIGIKSGKILLKRVDDYMIQDKSIIMESTISGRFHHQIIERARKMGYKTILYYLFLDLVEMNIQRVQNRVLLGGHNVPESDIYRRYKRSIKNFWSTVNVVDNWELHHNLQNGFELIAFGNDKKEIVNPKIFSLFKELQNENT